MCDAAPADYLVACMVVTTAAMSGLLKLYTGIWLDFSYNFSSEPWKKLGDGVLCPFFPLREACVQCPGCKTLVSREAFHTVRLPPLPSPLPGPPITRSNRRRPRTPRAGKGVPVWRGCAQLA